MPSTAVGTKGGHHSSAEADVVAQKKGRSIAARVVTEVVHE